MGARGRNSSAAPLALVSITAAQRPEPPPTLNAEASHEWRRVVASMPADWFASETLALLEQRCQQVVWLRRTNKRLNMAMKPSRYNQRECDKLMRQIAAQTRMLLQLDTAMRLTQQASYDKAKRKGTSARSGKVSPWSQADQ